MDVQCGKHGMQPSTHVSKDIFDNLANDQFRFMPVIVFFEFDDEIVESFYLSQKYAEKYNLGKNQVILLPDDYPQWTLDLLPICNECLKSILKEEYFLSDDYEKSEWIV